MSATRYFQPGDRKHRPELNSVFARDCEFVSENVEAHALGALPDDESARIDRHVSTCLRCAHLLDRALAVSALLPFLSKPVAAPEAAHPKLFARIMLDQPAQAAAGLPNLNPWQPGDSARSWTIPASKDAYAASLGAAPSIVNAPRTRRVKWDAWAAPLAAMPLVLALAIVGGWALNTRSNLQDQQNAMRAVQQENKTLNTQLLTRPAATTTSDNPMNFTLDSANSSSAQGAVSQLSNANGVSVKVWSLPSDVKSCKVELETMDGQRVNAGTFPIDNGAGNGTLSLSQPLDSFLTVHIVPLKTAAGGVEGTSSTSDLLVAQINSNLGRADGTTANSSSR